MPFSRPPGRCSLQSAWTAPNIPGSLPFNQHFVKSGEVRKDASKWLERAKLYREQADYGDFYIVSVHEAEAQIQSAREFIEEIETAIEKRSRP